MKKIEVLRWGIRHIAANYNLGADIESIENDGQACVFVTDEHPTVTPAPINDVQLMCDDLGIERGQIEINEYGIEVSVDYAWLRANGDYKPTGHEMWKKYNAVIGE